jgi:3-oxoacyl-[acyl-carrier protein] reductase
MCSEVAERGGGGALEAIVGAEVTSSGPLSGLLAGRRAVVTGGTRGIGRGIAEVLSDAGARIVITGRDNERGALVASELTDRGGNCSYVSADVRSAGDFAELAAQVRSTLGGLDLLVHNAGIYPTATIEEMSEADWDLVHNTNLKSTFLAVKAFLPDLKRSDAGRVVLISSITGPITGFSGLSHYAASKAGMNGFMRTAALELAPHGITINAVEPGSIATEGLDELGEEAITKMIDLIPVDRLGEPRDIGNAVAFLGSELASFISGQSIVVDGGQTLPEIPE